MITKPFCFRQLPAVRANPGTWRRHLLRDCPEVRSPAVPPTPTAEARAVLTAHMPELLPDFEALLAALEGQPWAPLALAMYNAPPFFTGCSVTVSRSADRATLLRNYDLGPDRFSGVLRCERLDGGGWIIGTAECGWGYLDGLNDRGLAVAITFGGRFTAGDGFGVPILVRCLLQTAGSVAEAVERLKRLPHRLVQNFLLLDRQGAHAVVYTSPDRGVVVAEGQACCTNHQRQVEIPGHGQFVQTLERVAHLEALGENAGLEDFLRPPLYSRRCDKGFGTLYTLEFDPVSGTARYAWPDRELFLHPDSQETEFAITYTPD